MTNSQSWNKIRSTSYLLPLAYCVIVFTAGCGEKKSENPIELTPINVKTEVTRQGSTDANQVAYSSAIEANKVIGISSLVSGTVISLPVNVGNFVSKGQLIASIDESVYRSQYDAQMAQVDLAEQTYKRLREVYNKGSVAEIRLLNAKADYDQASASAKAIYQNIARCKVYAPQSGYIGAKNLEAGASVAPGRSIVELYDLDFVSATVPVPEKEVSSIKKGQGAHVKVTSIDLEFAGTVDEIAVLPTSSSPIYHVKVKVKNTGNLIKPAMSCDVSFASPERGRKLTTGQIIVPSEAIQVDEARQYFVFVTDVSGKKAVRKTIQLGEVFAKGTGIRSGLQSGERLIISGFHKISDGSPVNIIP